MRVCQLALIGAALLLSLCPAAPDGMFMPPEEMYSRVYGDLGAASTEQKGIVIEAGEGREALLLQTTYQGPAGEFAWVIPVSGEPGEDDVFIASAEFIEHVLDTTAPRVETHIEVPEERHRGYEGVAMDAAPPPGPEPGGAPPTVTVHRRMDVGDYDVSVLSATGPEVLIDWLNENGYATPVQHANVIDHYVRQRWYFVALRVRPTVAEQKPVIDDVKPIGIEFATRELVYPLYISRASSRQKTALTLVALTARAVECDGLHPAELPLQQKFEPGASYSAIRRETVEGALRQPAAVVEYAGYGGVTAPDLHWVADRWPGEGAPRPVLMWATRWWTVLDLEEMEDLGLQPAAVEVGNRLVVERHGRLPGPGLLKSLNVPAAPVAAGLFVLFALWAGVTSRVPPELARAGLLLGAAGLFAPYVFQGFALLALLGGGLVALAILAAVIAGNDREGEPAPVGWWRLLAWAGLIGGWAWLAGLLGYISGQYSRDLYLPAEDFGPWGLWLVLWPVLAAAVIGREWRRWRAERLGFVLAAIVFSVPLWVMAHADSLGQGDFPAYIVGGIGALLFVTLAGCLTQLAWPGAARRMAQAPPAARVALVVGSVVSLGLVTLIVLAGGMGDQGFRSMVLRSLLGMAAAAPLAFAWIAIRGEPGARRAATAFALTLLILGLAVSFSRFSFVGPAYGGTMGKHNTGLHQLDSALARLDEALLGFIGDTGCYPASLRDLAASVPPAQGLDSSGNRVPVAGSFRGPYLPELPEDPLTGERDTWLYEVTGAPMIDTGGLTITLRRESTPALEQVQRGLFSSSPRPARYPFGMRSGGFDAINTDPEGAMARLVIGAYGGELLLADIGADIAAREPIEASRGPQPDAICLSPDGRQVAAAYNSERTAYVTACDVFYTMHVGPTGGRSASPGENFRHLLGGPWRAEITDIAWHPTEERWAALARPMESAERGPAYPGPLKLYVFDAQSHPRAITMLDEGRWVAWAPDGKSVYVLDQGTGWRPGGLTPAVLRRYSLDGTEIGAAQGTSLECFASNRHGTAHATPDAEAIEFIGPDGSRATLAPPESGALVEDLWVGPGAVVAAWAPNGGEGTGLVAVYAPPGAEPRVIGRYSVRRQVGVMGGPPGENTFRPIIIGRDQATGVVAMTWGIDPVRDREFGELAGIYALLPEAPYARRLPQGESLHGGRELRWADEPVQVEFVDWVPATALRTGDLVSENARYTSVEAVSGTQGGDLIVGRKRVPVLEGLPVIGETEFLLRYRAVDAGA